MRLSNYLLAKILANGLGVLLIAVAWLLVSDHLTNRMALAQAASAMERILEVQVVGPMQDQVLRSRFPDWYPVTRVARPDGACVRFFAPTGVVVRSECRGRANRGDDSPQWFRHAYARAFSPHKVINRDIDSTSAPFRLELAPDSDAQIARAWHKAIALTGPIALAIAVLCVTVWWSVRRAVRPAQEIMQGLSEIERGVHERHLGPYRWTEFDHIASAFNTLVSGLAANEAARATLTRRLLQVQEDERHLIACELHDEFGQHLTAIRASAAAFRSDATTRGREDALRIESSARHLMQIVRERLRGLRPWSAGEVDLPGSLHALCTDPLTNAGQRPRVECRLDADFERVPTDMASAVYRIVQEALTNAQRHADAKAIQIHVTSCNDVLSIEISDDGRGCEPDLLSTGFGIAGICERAQAFSGGVEFSRNDKSGLTVQITLPLVQETQ